MFALVEVEAVGESCRFASCVTLLGVFVRAGGVVVGETLEIAVRAVERLDLDGWVAVAPGALPAKLSCEPFVLVVDDFPVPKQVFDFIRASSGCKELKSAALMLV